MVALPVTRCAVYSEFDRKEQELHFSVAQKKVVHHIDTLYYTVSVQDDCNGNQDSGLLGLLADLKEAKAEKLKDMQSDVPFFGLSVMATGFSIYEYRLSLNETYDVFIASYLPNVNTPRICVQLRTRSLVLDGVQAAIENSYGKVRDILADYGLQVGTVSENRIDYAFHTNLIQSSERYFSDENLKKHLRTTFRKYHKIGEIGRDIHVDTFNLGMRKSNNTFFRCYNKTREVIEKNYKSFFFKRWLDYGLISRYDAFCYEQAFSMQSYGVGLLVGRIQWYLFYGKNPALKEKLSRLLECAYANSDNAAELEKQIDGILPPVTVVTNIEFQTKRKFYYSFDDFIDTYCPNQTLDKPYAVASDYKPAYAIPALTRLYKILDLRRSFLDYLCSDCVAFVKDKSAKELEYCDWWYRIRACRVDDRHNAPWAAWRNYDRETDIRRASRRFSSAVAQLAVLRNGLQSDKSFTEDISDALAYLNDNDFYGFSCNPETGEIPEIMNPEYILLKERKKRQYKGVLTDKQEN